MVLAFSICVNRSTVLDRSVTRRFLLLTISASSDIRSTMSEMQLVEQNTNTKNRHRVLHEHSMSASSCLVSSTAIFSYLILCVGLHFGISCRSNELSPSCRFEQFWSPALLSESIHISFRTTLSLFPGDYPVITETDLRPLKTSHNSSNTTRAHDLDE